jgi:GTP-binding protein
LSEEKLAETYLKVRNELSKYDKTLTRKKEIIVFNKSDLIGKKELEKKLKVFKNKIKKKYEIISIVADKNLINLRKILLKNAN